MCSIKLAEVLSIDGGFTAAVSQALQTNVAKEMWLLIQIETSKGQARNSDLCQWDASLNSDNLYQFITFASGNDCTNYTCSRCISPA